MNLREKIPTKRIVSSHSEPFCLFLASQNQAVVEQPGSHKCHWKFFEGVLSLHGEPVDVWMGGRCEVNQVGHYPRAPNISKYLFMSI